MGVGRWDRERLVTQAYITNIGKVEAGGSGVYPWMYSEIEANLGYMRLYFKKIIHASQWVLGLQGVLPCTFEALYL